MPDIFINQVVEFSAAHRLSRSDFSVEENQRVFGKCANPNGHGHNYKLEACFTGQVDETTGMVVHFDRLKTLLGELVVEPLDHKNLNVDVSFLQGRLPSSENLVLALWDNISAAIKGEEFKLHRLSLWSSERHRVDCFGGKNE